MTIGDIIKRYRQENRLSQREFAKRCKVTNGYISMLENDYNPKTSKPIVPTLERLKCIADGMCISLQELIEMADDMPVDLSSDRAQGSLSEDEQQLLSFYRSVNTDGRRLILSSAESVACNAKFKIGSSAGMAIS